MAEKEYFKFIERAIYVFLLFGIVLGIALSFRNTQESKTLYAYIQDWKELISASVALFGAWIAYRAATYQFLDSKKVERERFEKENTAARSVMPIALSAICEYSINNLCFVSEIEEYKTGKRQTEPTRNTIDLSQISFLKNAIIYSPKEISINISEIVGLIQINEARMRDYCAEPAQRPYIISRIYQQYDCIMIYNKASNLFKYARIYMNDEAKDAPSTPLSTMHVLLRHIEDPDAMERLIRQRNPDGIP
jgi:hypothetical protein